METKGRNRTMLFMLIFSIVALLITLVGIGVVIVNLINPTSASAPALAEENNPNSAANQVPLETISHSGEINYDFSVKQATAEGVKDEFSKSELQFTFPNLENDRSNNLARISIPSLKIDSPIIFGTDGDAALDQGMWLYPGSYITKGEKIFFCHRRYWGRNHPYSCWYLDQVAIGAEIRLQTKTGENYIYKVISVAQVPAEDNNYLKASPDDYVKIITCAPLGKSTHRLIVIGKLVQ